MPGQDFGAMNYLRRTDSKDSNCTSLSSVSHMHGRDDLRASMSVPPIAFGVSLILAIYSQIIYIQAKLTIVDFNLNLLSDIFFSE